MSTTQDNAIQAGAELTYEACKDIGARCGLPEGTQASVVAERVLAIAWADIAHFRGGNDTPERLEEVCKLACSRLTAEIKNQHFLRRGHKSFLKA